MKKSSTDSKRVIELLKACREGNVDALNQLMPIIYNELRRLARKHFRRERRNNTLQTTALVHEAYLKLLDDPPKNFETRAHFFGIAANVMSQILIQHAREKMREKRGGKYTIFAPEEIDNVPAQEREIDLILLDEALKKLKRINPVNADIVVKRYFGGLTIDEIVEVTGIPKRTVERKWKFTKTWLYKEIYL